MKRKLILSAITLYLLGGTVADAAQVNVGIGVGVPVVAPAYVAPAPVYVAPPPPVYVAPYPMYYDPYHRGRDFRYWHDRRVHEHR